MFIEHFCKLLQWRLNYQEQKQNLQKPKNSLQFFSTCIFFLKNSSNGFFKKFQVEKHFYAIFYENLFPLSIHWILKSYVRKNRLILNCSLLKLSSQFPINFQSPSHSPSLHYLLITPQIYYSNKLHEDKVDSDNK